MMTRKRRNKTLKLAKGYWGAKSKHFKMANEQVMKSLTYAYVGRRLKKRDFRQLWITRVAVAGPGITEVDVDAVYLTRSKEHWSALASMKNTLVSPDWAEHTAPWP